MLGVRNIRDKLEKTEKQIWELAFCIDSYDEDNDSDYYEEEDEEAAEEEWDSEPSEDDACLQIRDQE